MTRWIVPCLVVSLAAGLLAGQEEKNQFLFIAENEFGKVWANTSLTSQRTEEAYLPMVVAVENKASKPITLNRSSFSLSDLDGIVYEMPTVKEQRKNYGKILIDGRMVSFNGIPWEGWRRNRRLEPVNFYPNMDPDAWARRGVNTTVDTVTLRQRHAMADLLYFERPRNLSLNRPFFLEVRPKKGWETPIRLRIVLS